MQMKKEEAQERFDAFLMDMDEQLEWLEDEAEQHGISFDSTPDDFEKLEQLFDLMSSNQEKEYVSKLTTTFARQLGEVVRLNYGGKWVLALEEEKSPHFNMPVIVGHTPVQGVEFAPILVMRAYALRRKKGTLKRAVDAQVDPKPLDLSGMVEES